MSEPRSVIASARFTFFKISEGICKNNSFIFSALTVENKASKSAMFNMKIFDLKYNFQMFTFYLAIKI